MTNRTALIALRDAVVAGKWGPETQALRSPPSTFKTPFAPEPMDKRRRQAWSAYHGSVDAAIALLEAVLPGASFWVETKIDGIHHAGVFIPNLGRTFQAEAPNLGRALLIATLNALIAEEKTD